MEAASALAASINFFGTTKVQGLRAVEIRFPIKFPPKPWIDFPVGTLSDSGQKVEKIESKIFKYS